MFPVRPNPSSQEIYVGARLLVDLHEAGVGLCEAVEALEPVAEAIWTLVRTRADAESLCIDDLERPSARLLVDPSVTVTYCGAEPEDELQSLAIEIARPGRFIVMLRCYAWPTGDFLPFWEKDPTIGLEAVDVNELANFLALAKLHGGELVVDSEGADVGIRAALKIGTGRWCRAPVLAP